jgi:hypothetical protein
MYNSFGKAIREKIIKAYFLLMVLNLEKTLFWPVDYQIMVLYVLVCFYFKHFRKWIIASSCIPGIDMPIHSLRSIPTRKLVLVLFYFVADLP